MNIRLLLIFILFIFSTMVLVGKSYANEDGNNHEKQVTDKQSSEMIDNKLPEDKQTAEVIDKQLSKNKQISETEDKEQPHKKEYYHINIHSNDEKIDKVLYEYLSIVTKRFANNIDEDQIQFLIEETPEEVNQILGTLGYFNNQVQVIQNTPKDYTVKVKLGKRVYIKNIIVVYEGPIEEDEDLSYYYNRTLLNWSLPIGSPFLQDEWAKSRDLALNVAKQWKYPLAKITESQAQLDPNTGSGILTVVVNSAQPIRLSTIHVTGSQRYPEEVVKGLANFKDGSDYSLKELTDYQKALEQDGHFSNVLVHANLDKMVDDTVPVEVEVKEVPYKKLELGLNYDSEEGPGARATYTYYNLFGKGYIGSTSLDLNRYEKNFGIGISQPRQRNGHYYTSSLNYKDNNIQNLETKAISAGLWKVRLRDGIDSRIGIEHYRESSNIKGGEKRDSTYATLITASWRRNLIETEMRPANGYYAYGKIGTTLGNLGSSASLQMLKADMAYYYTPDKREYGTFIVRGSVGYVYTKNEDNVPTDLLFRTGGSGSVRGYEYNGIGLDGPRSSVLPGRSMVAASFEYQYPLNQDYSVAVFHDVGDVKNNFKKINLRHSTGVGVRWFSPVAPLAFDIAYAHQRKKFAWHLNLGAQF